VARVNARGSRYYDDVTLKIKPLPFRYETKEQRILIPTSAAIHTTVLILSFVYLLICFVAWMQIIRGFIKLCVDIARGNFFIPENKNRLNVIAYGIIILNLLPMLFPYVLRLLFTRYITDDIVMVHKPFLEMGWQWLLLGVFFWLLAKAFHKGMQLQEEQDLTV
jgi:hypothetical protein